ncbi:unnamed protein product [Nesidiocoris tenuis]|uniref:WD repeat-containing protein 55 homolog n=1 Tax=Nesidiocoris tenuis TaxID=355587 RepID=A0A6H5G643_9HEMI|nr:unnamed protein product [Nesidiocoris tenuis]CAA9997376.1 unnamed protein product [Nesidiocoris tenuis]
MPSRRLSARQWRLHGRDGRRLRVETLGRVQCIAWHPEGKFIATGSVDSVRVWQIATGHALHRMTTGRVMKHVETRVWSVAVTDDFTVITGDSRRTAQTAAAPDAAGPERFNVTIFAARGLSRQGDCAYTAPAGQAECRSTGPRND